jgi:hypothetical protein
MEKRGAVNLQVGWTHLLSCQKSNLDSSAVLSVNLPSDLGSTLERKYEKKVDKICLLA